MRLAMQLLATVAYCALTSFQAAGLRPGSHPILLSHNRSSAPTTRCTDRSSSGYDGAERIDVPNVAVSTATKTGNSPEAPIVGRPLAEQNRSSHVVAPWPVALWG